MTSARRRVITSRTMANGRRRRELRAIAKQGRLIAGSALGRSRSALADEHGERVAVFVHGYMAAGPVFDPLRARVETELGLRTLDFTYGPLRSFDAVLAGLESHIAAHVPEGAEVSFVGHSLGGILARAYLLERPGGSRVDRVLTIASPHDGTTAVRFLPVGPATVLRPKSALLARLRERHRESRGVPHLAIIAGADRLCSPPESAGRLEGAEVHRFDELGHNEVLFDPRVHELVIRRLR